MQAAAANGPLAGLVPTPTNPPNEAGVPPRWFLVRQGGRSCGGCELLLSLRLLPPSPPPLLRAASRGAHPRKHRRRRAQQRHACLTTNINATAGSHEMALRHVSRSGGDAENYKVRASLLFPAGSFSKHPARPPQQAHGGAPPAPPAPGGASRLRLAAASSAPGGTPLGCMSTLIASPPCSAARNASAVFSRGKWWEMSGFRSTRPAATRSTAGR